MPIFMDLHEVPGVTAKEAIQAHQMDVAVQDQYNCCIKTVWLDIHRGKGFCLIEAPDKEAVELMHKNAHGMVPNKIIEVESSIVELMLGRASDPQIINSSKENENFLSRSPYRTIMNIELRDPSVTDSNTKIKELSEIRKHCIQTIKQAVVKYNGIQVMHSAEGFIASFSSVVNSVQCAVDIHDNFRIYNAKSSLIKINAAIGLHTGAPVTREDDFFGDSIQLTKRLCSISKGSRILLSSAIRETDFSISAKPSYNGSLKILSPAEEDFLNRLFELIERVWNDESYNVDRLSRELGLSKAQLYRKVTSLTGSSPNVFLRDYRLSRAIQMLKTMKGNISEIALEAGFANPSYFSKCFFRKFGVLPSEYASRIL